MKKILSLLLILTLFPLNLTADNSKTPKIPCDFVGYETKAAGLITGDEVCVKDSQSNILGKFTVCVDGQYGFLSIPADDPQTTGKDGALANEALFFYVNDVEQQVSAEWQEGKVVQVDLGLPKDTLTIKITSPQAEKAVSANPVTISGEVNNIQAQVEVILNDSTTFTPQVNPDGTFSVPNVNLTGGLNLIRATAEDVALNSAETQLSVYSGWVLHLKDMPWYEKEKSHYSGAATCKMILDFLRQEDETTGKTQDELYNHGHALNLTENSGLSELDGKGLDAVLGHFDPYDTPENPWYDREKGTGNPYQGYNFYISVFDPAANSDAFTEYLRDIAHWMSYNVTVDHWSTELVAQPNSPAAVPLDGSYEHWVAVNGVVTSANPTPVPGTIPEVTVYGFWLTDPANKGISKNIYVTASEVGKTYFLPLTSNDEYNGKYMQVAEPPPVLSEAKVEIAPEEVNDSTLKLIKIAEDKTHRYDVARVVNLDEEIGGISWQEIINAQALTDTDFREAIEDSIVREFIKVEREDNGSSYYIVPFDKYIKGQFLTYAALTIDAQTGAFKQASWLEEPVRFVPVNKEKAEKLAREYCAEEILQISSRLIWQPQGPSNSPFFPYWKVIVNEQTLYVTQDGQVHMP
jgi:hypothetical protein